MTGRTRLPLKIWLEIDAASRTLFRMFVQAHTAVRAQAERLGLKIDWDDPSATISKLAWLTQTPKKSNSAEEPRWAKKDR